MTAEKLTIEAREQRRAAAFKRYARMTKTELVERLADVLDVVATGSGPDAEARVAMLDVVLRHGLKLYTYGVGAVDIYSRPVGGISGELQSWELQLRVFVPLAELERWRQTLDLGTVTRRRVGADTQLPWWHDSCSGRLPLDADRSVGIEVWTNGGGCE